jgi:aminopeptidase N
MSDKSTALRSLKGKPEYKEIVDAAIKEEHYLFRKTVVGLITDEAQLEDLAKNDPHSSVRSEALKALYGKNNNKGALAAKQVLVQEKAYDPITKALEILAQSDPKLALDEVDKIASENPKPLFSTIADIYAKSKETRYLDFFEKNLHEVSIYSIFNYYDKYYKLAKEADVDRIVETTKVMMTGALGASNPFYKRFVSTNTINKLKEELSSRMEDETDASKKSKLSSSVSLLQEMIDDIKSKEQDTDLLQRYGSF